MGAAVLEVEGLRKEFLRLRGGRTVALDGLDLAVPEGGVFGFLGPNGSGKTTTIRCLLGLVRPTAGSCHVLGADSRTQLWRVIGRVGSIVEAPSLFPTFSGRQNLALAGAVGGAGKRAVAAALERVGLADRAGDLVKNYSLGMKQRLAIAAALLGDPQVLILDEPANGLDPSGIKDVRDLLRGLGAEGRTVFVSSHQLAEVQQICTRVAILSRGRCIASGSVADVLARGTTHAIVVRMDDPERGRDVLRSAGVTASLNDDVLLVQAPGGDGSEVARILAGAGLYPKELRPDEVSLEDVFLELTRDSSETSL